MTWKERFFRFLKEKGVYGEWVYNIYEQHPIWDNTFWEGISLIIFLRVIDRAFPSTKNN